MKIQIRALALVLALALAAPILLVGPVLAQAGGKFGSRHNGNSRLAARGNPAAAAIRQGLEWLVAHQDQDGSWDPATFVRPDARRDAPPTDGVGAGLSTPAATAFVLLALLGDGSTRTLGTHAKSVGRALDWLERQQDDHGGFRGCLPRQETREHAVLTYALVEAAGLSRTPGVVAERAVSRLLALRGEAGLWSRNTTTKEADHFASFWAACALQSAADFHIGAVTPLPPLRERFTESARAADAARTEAAAAQEVQEAKGGPAVDGHRSVELASEVFCRFLLGEDPKGSASFRELIQRFAAIPAAAAYGDADLELWWHGSQAAYQVGGRIWSAWSRPVMPALVAAQRQDGNFAGSWDPVGPGAKAGGRVYATALAVLTLEAHYRYTQLVR